MDIKVPSIEHSPSRLANICEKKMLPMEAGQTET
jgi:hypothetical protein